MVTHRWSPRLVPPLLVAALLALGWVATVPRAAEAIPRRVVVAVRPAPRANPPLAALPTLADLPACNEALRAALARANPTSEAPDVGAWYQLDPRLDAGGSLVGQLLTVGQGDAQSALVLGAESAASGPTGPAVVVLSDDGTRSTVAVVDAGAGCAWPIAGSDAIVRRALLEPGGDAIVEHRLDRATRNSLGIWRRPLDGQAAARILDPIRVDDRFGRTFATELAWADGRRLVVQSCGPSACRTRILDLATGNLRLAVDDDRQGEIIGVDGSTLVTYEACSDLPCAIVATDLRAGTRRVLTGTAGFARLATGPRGTRLVHEVGGPGSGLLRAVALTGGPDHEIRVGPGRLLAPSPMRSRSSMALPPGWLLVTDDGRAHGPGTRTLIDPSSGEQQNLSEVTR